MNVSLHQGVSGLFWLTQRLHLCLECPGPCRNTWVLFPGLAQACLYVIESLHHNGNLNRSVSSFHIKVQTREWKQDLHCEAPRDCSDVSRMWPLPSDSMTATRVLVLPHPIKRSRRRAQPLPLKHPSEKPQVLQLVCNWLELSHMAPCSCKGGWECSPSAEHIAAQNRSRGLLPKVGMGAAQAGNSLHHSEQPVYLHRPGEKGDTEPLEQQIDFILKSSPSDCSWLFAVPCWTQSP